MRKIFKRRKESENVSQLYLNMFCDTRKYFMVDKKIQINKLKVIGCFFSGFNKLD